jgi:hypothetical protein
MLTKSCCPKLQVVKSAKNLIQRVGRVMLEVDVLPGENGYYVENSNKQVFRMIVALRIYNAASHFLAVSNYV